MLFGEIINRKMVYNEYGRIAVEEVSHTNNQRQKDDIFIPEYVIIPNHVHFIVNIVGTRLAVSAKPQFEAFAKPTKNSLSTIIRSYKSAVTKRIREAEMDAASRVPTKYGDLVTMTT